jgi:hypothetical protein
MAVICISFHACSQLLQRNSENSTSKWAMITFIQRFIIRHLIQRAIPFSMTYNLNYFAIGLNQEIIGQEQKLLNRICETPAHTHMTHCKVKYDNIINFYTF